MVAIRPLSDQTSLDQLVNSQPLQPFLQSWAWGEFQQAVGRRIWRLGAYDGESLIGTALVIEHQLILGKTYLYCPRGPLALNLAAWQELLAAIQQTGALAGAMYGKIDPGLTPFSLDLRRPADGYEFGSSLQPSPTLMLNVRQTPAELLAAMHQKTRYNIRLAEKRGVIVRWSTEPEDFRIFYDLMAATYQRQGIRLHPREYYRQLWQVLSATKMLELAIAEYNGQAITANMVIWHGQTATYLHGGSADEHKDLMAPHLVQWRTIERAKERGVLAYDFWGIAPEDQPQHKWAGVTRFKKGFGGSIVKFPPSLNTIIQPSWYWAYRMAKRMRGGVDA